MNGYCDICTENSVVREHDGHSYCLRHHELFCRCVTHEWMLEMHAQEQAETGGAS
jgi:hypothetical protein